MLLQANIGGYKGRTATVIGFLDLENHQLQIEISGKMVDKRFKSADGEEAGLISNQPLDDMDYQFSEQDFAEAFKAYRLYANSDRLLFSTDTQRAKPMLEVDKITEKGSQFAIYGDITNEQVATLALCLFAKMAEDSQIALAMYDEEKQESDDFYYVSI